MIWQVTNESTISEETTVWTTMPTPSEYNLDYEDLDSDSYRSAISGNLMRNRVKPRWAKVSMEFSLIDASTCNQIASAVNQNQKFYFQGLSPVFGNLQSNK